jgi:hypothetical protein
MATKDSGLKLTIRQREGRAINAVVELLRRRLSVPNIYIEPPSSAGRADVLAVDRGGAGDLHAVEVKLASDLYPEGLRGRPSNPKELHQAYGVWHEKYVKKLAAIYRHAMEMPAHYRYLAIPEESFNLALGKFGPLGLFPEDGIGRLGVITIREKGNEAPVAEIKVDAERFRVDAARLRAIELRILAKTRPDIEVRI